MGVVEQKHERCACPNASVLACIDVYLCVFVYIHTYIYIYIYTHTHLSACSNNVVSNMYVCMYVHMYVCVYIYAGTHTHSLNRISDVIRI